MGKKYPNTKEGKRMRRYAADVQYGKHAAGKQFNPANGEPHTKAWLDHQREIGLHRKRG